MLEVALAACGSNMFPTVEFDQSNQVTNLYCYKFSANQDRIEPVKSHQNPLPPLVYCVKPGIGVIRRTSARKASDDEEIIDQDQLR